MKLNGWQRLRVVLSAIWCIGVLTAAMPSVTWIVEHPKGPWFGRLNDDHPLFITLERDASGAAIYPPKAKSGEMSPGERTTLLVPLKSEFNLLRFVVILFLPLYAWALVVLVVKTARWVLGEFKGRAQ